MIAAKVTFAKFTFVYISLQQFINLAAILIFYRPHQTSYKLQRLNYLL